MERAHPAQPSAAGRRCALGYGFPAGFAAALGLTRPTPTRSRPAALARLRRVDRAVRGVQPVWKLLGRGSVGGQTLLGIPAVAGLRADPACPIRDQAQVRAVVRWLAALDAAGHLGLSQIVEVRTAAIARAHLGVRTPR